MECRALDSAQAFDVLYALAADGGREEALFGACAPLAREAILGAPVDSPFSLLWFELPLLGRPGFDIHMAYARDAGAVPGREGRAADLFRWYAAEDRGGNGLALAYDLREGNIHDPAVHVNVNDAPLADPQAFFNIVADEGAGDAFRAFAARLPQGWRVWYFGVHPARPGSPVRVDCYVDEGLKWAYAADPGLFERDLRACGFTATGSTLRQLAAPILESPFALELQFDVAREGGVGSTLGISAALGASSAGALRRTLEDGGAGAALLEKAARMGLADARWRGLPGTCFAKAVDAGGSQVAFQCAPLWVKLRMRDGEALDAKAYLQARAFTL